MVALTGNELVLYRAVTSGRGSPIQNECSVQDIANLGNAGGAFQSITVNISSAQILAMHTTPVELLPAPGANKAVIPLSTTVLYSYGGVSYTHAGTAVLAVGWDVNTISFYTFNGMLLETSSQIAFGVNAQGNIYDLTDGENKPVSFSTNSAYAAGDGTMKAICVYQIMDV